jgi:hypothetical protein
MLSECTKYDRIIITLSEDLIKQMDRERGSVSRSTYIQLLLEKYGNQSEGIVILAKNNWLDCYLDDRSETSQIAKNIPRLRDNNLTIMLNHTEAVWLQDELYLLDLKINKELKSKENKTKETIKELEDELKNVEYFRRLTSRESKDEKLYQICLPDTWLETHLEYCMEYFEKQSNNPDRAEFERERLEMTENILKLIRDKQTANLDGDQICFLFTLMDSYSAARGEKRKVEYYWHQAAKGYDEIASEHNSRLKREGRDINECPL